MNANNLDVESFDSEIAAPQRTSILAILSLVCSLICLIPGTGVLAAIFGISALVGIRGSRGRVGGTGLAIAGLIVGLLFTMVWIGIVVGMNALMQEFTGKLVAPMNQAIISMDANRIRLLNRVGSFLWERCDGSTVDHMVAAVCEHFDVGEATARADVERFLDDLTSRGLLRPEAPGP